MNNWISTKDKLPEPYQDVIFIVKSSDEFYNNRLLGGKYTPDCCFSVPGIGFSASYWMPAPKPPKQQVEPCEKCGNQWNHDGNECDGIPF